MRPQSYTRPASRIGGGRSLLASLIVALCATAAFTAPALAKINKEDFARFKNCPTAVAQNCLYGETTSGEFKLGSKSVPIVNTVILQGGLQGAGMEALPLVPPLNGAETVSATPQPVPGGLTGISEAIGGPTYGVAELAGPVTINPFNLLGGLKPAIEMPLKVHLENELLGENCYVGSDAEPIVLHLTTGATAPPAGTEPINGSLGKTVLKDKARIVEYDENSLVDNTFSVPAATGCGTSVLTEAATTLLVNTATGLPSAAGNNVAILNGTQYRTESVWAVKYNKVKKKH